MSQNQATRLEDMTRELMRDIDDHLAELDANPALAHPCYCGRRIFAHEPHCTGAPS